MYTVLIDTIENNYISRVVMRYCIEIKADRYMYTYICIFLNQNVYFEREEREVEKFVLRVQNASWYLLVLYVVCMYVCICI